MILRNAIERGTCTPCDPAIRCDTSVTPTSTLLRSQDNESPKLCQVQRSVKVPKSVGGRRMYKNRMRNEEILGYFSALNSWYSCETGRVLCTRLRWMGSFISAAESRKREMCGT